MEAVARASVISVWFGVSPGSPRVHERGRACGGGKGATTSSFITLAPTRSRPRARAEETSEALRLHYQPERTGDGAPERTGDGAPARIRRMSRDPTVRRVGAIAVLVAAIALYNILVPEDIKGLFHVLAIGGVFFEARRLLRGDR